LELLVSNAQHYVICGILNVSYALTIFMDQCLYPAFHAVHSAGSRLSSWTMSACTLVGAIVGKMARFRKPRQMFGPHWRDLRKTGTCERSGLRQNLLAGTTT
jgi:hypothetical protein